MRYSFLWISYLVLGLPSLVGAQEVLVSKGFNIRNDQAYEILGDVGEHTLIYRDRGDQKAVIALDSSLNFLWQKYLSFESDRQIIYGLAPKDTSFLTFQGYRDEDEMVVNAAVFSDNASRMDTVEILREPRGMFSGDCQFELSERGSKTLLYYVENAKSIRFFVFDNDREELLWSDSFTIDDVNLNRDLVQINVSELGEIFLLFEKAGNTFRREESMVELLGIFNKGEITKFQTFKINNKKVKDTYFKIDNEHRRLGVFALFGKRKATESQGIGYSAVSISEFIQNDLELDWTEFDKELIMNVTGNDGQRGIKYLRLIDVIWRRDGGFIVLAEEQREFSRRNNYAVGGNFNNNFYGGAGWIDYFNEDIAVLAYHPSGEEHWNEVLYKKQFSQDDRAIFSSFFIFQTPSRLRLLYNDEIKNSSIVSEYIVGPQGRSKRSSVLNTEYQNLRLRFRDALQVSSNELYVPSERSGSLSIVKISY